MLVARWAPKHGWSKKSTRVYRDIADLHDLVFEYWINRVYNSLIYILFRILAFQSKQPVSSYVWSSFYSLSTSGYSAILIHWHWTISWNVNEPFLLVFIIWNRGLCTGSNSVLLLLSLCLSLEIIFCNKINSSNSGFNSELQWYWGGLPFPICRFRSIAHEWTLPSLNELRVGVSQCWQAILTF